MAAVEGPLSRLLKVLTKQGAEEAAGPLAETLRLAAESGEQTAAALELTLSAGKETMDGWVNEVQSALLRQQDDFCVAVIKKLTPQFENVLNDDVKKALREFPSKYEEELRGNRCARSTTAKQALKDAFGQTDGAFENACDQYGEELAKAHIPMDWEEDVKEAAETFLKKYHSSFMQEFFSGSDDAFSKSLQAAYKACGNEQRKKLEKAVVKILDEFAEENNLSNLGTKYAKPILSILAKEGSVEEITKQIGIFVAREAAEEFLGEEVVQFIEEAYNKGLSAKECWESIEKSFEQHPIIKGTLTREQAADFTVKIGSKFVPGGKLIRSIYGVAKMLTNTKWLQMVAEEPIFEIFDLSVPGRRASKRRRISVRSAGQEVPAAPQKCKAIHFSTFATMLKCKLGEEFLTEEYDELWNVLITRLLNYLNLRRPESCEPLFAPDAFSSLEETKEDVRRLREGALSLELILKQTRPNLQTYFFPSLMKKLLDAEQATKEAVKLLLDQDKFDRAFTFFELVPNPACMLFAFATKLVEGGVVNEMIQSRLSDAHSKFTILVEAYQDMKVGRHDKLQQVKYDEVKAIADYWKSLGSGALEAWKAYQAATSPAQIGEAIWTGDARHIVAVDLAVKSFDWFHSAYIQHGMNGIIERFQVILSAVNPFQSIKEVLEGAEETRQKLADVEDDLLFPLLQMQNDIARHYKSALHFQRVHGGNPEVPGSVIYKTGWYVRRSDGNASYCAVFKRPTMDSPNAHEQATWISDSSEFELLDTKTGQLVDMSKIKLEDLQRAEELYPELCDIPELENKLGFTVSYLESYVKGAWEGVPKKPEVKYTEDTKGPHEDNFFFNGTRESFQVSDTTHWVPTLGWLTEYKPGETGKWQWPRTDVDKMQFRIHVTKEQLDQMAGLDIDEAYRKAKEEHGDDVNWWDVARGVVKIGAGLPLLWLLIPGGALLPWIDKIIDQRISGEFHVPTEQVKIANSDENPIILARPWGRYGRPALTLPNGKKIRLEDGK